MDLASLLLTIVNKLDGERTISAGYHLLRGKRSGQTLQDVEYYKLKKYFGVIPKLSAEVFEEAVSDLLAKKLIEIHETSLVHMTKEGREVVSKYRVYHFNGWDYRGRVSIFFARLSLIVQTLSHFKGGESNFIPIQKDLEVQMFVKEFLRGQPIKDPAFSVQLKKELVSVLERSELTEVQKTILTHRLIGYGYIGWTWGQLADELDIQPMALHLSFIESLHMLLRVIEETEGVPLLKKISTNIKVDSHLTDSSQKTQALFERGMSMEEIATTRQLKMSTIEDHFVEMVMNDARFPLNRFVTEEERNMVTKKVSELGTKRLRMLKEFFPQLTYFQLRLILGAQSKGEAL